MLNLDSLQVFTWTFSGNIWRSVSEYSSVNLRLLSRVAFSLNAHIVLPSSLPSVKISTKNFRRPEAYHDCTYDKSLDDNKIPSVSESPLFFHDKSSFPTALHSSGFQPDRPSCWIPTLSAPIGSFQELTFFCATLSASESAPPRASTALTNLYILQKDS